MYARFQSREAACWAHKLTFSSCVVLRPKALAGENTDTTSTPVQRAVARTVGTLTAQRPMSGTAHRGVSRGPATFCSAGERRQHPRQAAVAAGLLRRTMSTIAPTVPTRKATGQSKVAIKKNATSRTSIAVFRIGQLPVTVARA